MDEPQAKAACEPKVLSVPLACSTIPLLRCLLPEPLYSHGSLPSPPNVALLKIALMILGELRGNRLWMV